LFRKQLFETQNMFWKKFPKWFFFFQYFLSFSFFFFLCSRRQWRQLRRKPWWQQQWWCGAVNGFWVFSSYWQCTVSNSGGSGSNSPTELATVQSKLIVVWRWPNLTLTTYHYFHNNDNKIRKLNSRLWYELCIGYCPFVLKH